MTDLKTKILVIDDEDQMRKLLELTLSAHGFKLEYAVDGREGISFANTIRPELIILDLGLPDISGQEVLQNIRTWSEIPIIVLSAQNDSQAIVDSLYAGADDYITKPFEPSELLARIKVCLRRTLKKDFQDKKYQFDNLFIDLEARVVTKNGLDVKLTSTEYDLLKLFIKNANKVLTNRQILKEIWGPGSSEHTQYPRVYVRYLRQKIEDDPNQPELILTEPGVGYRLKLK